MDVILKSHRFVVAFDGGVTLVELRAHDFVLGPLSVQSLERRVRNSECVLVADFLLEVYFEHGASRGEQRLVETLVNPLALSVGAVSITGPSQRYLGDSEMFAVRTACGIHIRMRRLEPHVAQVALAEVKLTQSPPDGHPGRNTCEPSGRPEAALFHFH